MSSEGFGVRQFIASLILYFKKQLSTRIDYFAEISNLTYRYGFLVLPK